MKPTLHRFLVVPLLICAAAQALTAAEPLALLGANADLPNVTFNQDLVTVDQPENALAVAITPGDGSPAIYLRNALDVPWDLSNFGHLEAWITNTSDVPIQVSLRVDNKSPDSDKPWNTESAVLQPGENGPIKVVFGYHFGYRPGFALDPSAISAIAIFTEKTEVPITFRIESITAGGEPGEVPPAGRTE